MRTICTLLLAALLAAPAPVAPVARAETPSLKPQLQHLVDTYLATRAGIEKISGVALRIDNGGEAIAVYAGNNGLPGRRPIDGRTLFQIGSNTKHFTAALILKLESQGLLSIDDTLGKFLPQYPAWRDVTLRSLLDMTSNLPNYSETPAIGRLIAADPHHQFTAADLIAAVYPGDEFPKPTGWFYSNTNNILAALVIEAVAHMTYKQALETLLLKPLHLDDTFYFDGPTPPVILARLPRGIYANRDCLLYQPKPCTAPTLDPLIGRDMRAQNLSWAGAAGAIISTPRDLAIWIRALFAQKVFPQKQLDEMTQIVSQQTGAPIDDVSEDDPRGFALDLARMDMPQMGGRFWFYEGMTLGYRAIFAYWPEHNLIITGATNSQPPDGEDDFGKLVIGPAFAVVTTGDRPADRR